MDTSNSSEITDETTMQALVNKIRNNVVVIVHNLVLKYVDEDVVLSLSCKSVELTSADLNWQKGFMDYLGTKKLVHKICTITDLTLCLDKKSGDGKIEIYQGFFFFFLKKKFKKKKIKIGN